MREEASKIALEVNSILREYLAVQNGLFKFSFKKALGLVKPDPSSASASVVPLIDRLEVVRRDIKELSPQSDTAEGRFLIALRGYAKAMSSAMISFQELCSKLEEGSKDRSYRKKSYPEDMRQFQLKEAEYLEIGLRLNDLKKDLSSDSEK
ncbi:hypothetical protein [Dethiosulfovibrio salsuginis]|uniref:Uncharacterized protein n=1 Tax=Dethiosulfovibrio salsuginis TaxID=561720 RepID=A0A1X7JSX2_9BACT|nr:hypothetical protein [Dethiosulfovibrio salsuginis]SMG31464.1 hypothetical protein SAMN06275492_11611 [Dethiosulfovibrio salsuginis]